MSEERKKEIEFVMGMITELCKTADIGIIAKDVKGRLMPVIVDAQDGKEYVITKQ